MEVINDRGGMMDVISKSIHHRDNDTDDDDDDALPGGGTTTETTTCEPDLTETAGLAHHCGGGGRDEVGEVRKMSSKDTYRLRLWRIVVTGVLLLTAFAVTFTTYTLLKQQEEENFHTAFDQFARTVGDAAVDQQRRMREAFVGFANHISSTAQDINATWPIFRIPNFELHAAQVRLQSGVEYIGCQYLVEPKDAEEYLKFVTANYEGSMIEGHMTRYGNLDRLIPVGYTPNFTVATPTGLYPDKVIDRPLRSATWQISPPTATYHSTNLDAFAFLPFSLVAGQALLELRNETLFTSVQPYTTSASSTEQEHDAMHSSRPNSNINYPHSYVSTPVHENPNDTNSKIVGILGGLFAWDYALRYLLPNNVGGIVVEVRNTCNQSNMYALDGYDAFYLGENATKEMIYNNMEVIRDLSYSTHPNFTTTPGHCRYTIHIFPSSTFHNSYKTNTPAIYAAVVAFTFALVAAVFFIYDLLVQQRNEKIVVSAARSNAIVSSIFPDAFRDRLLQRNDLSSKHGQLKSYLLNGGGDDDAGNQSSKPLADLFLETTVLFADISGFTAWSSVREPTQVFLLLEAVYKAFDAIANRRHVFKVETVGDCYVAVTGLPEPQKDHAVVMARFARDIMSTMVKVTRDQELTLGPGTADLKLRIGMHSGPVTGGVLRGERSRFQLFGDTMNTTARIESTGIDGFIQLSSVTAELLIQAGKQAWVKPRDECIIAKGKGSMQTYWLANVRDYRDDATIGAESDRRCNSSFPDARMDYDEFVVRTDHNGRVVTLSQQTARLIDWNVEHLVCLLRQIVASRLASKPQSQVTCDSSSYNIGKTPIDEVQEIITLPEFDINVNHQNIDAVDVVVSPIVIEQLKEYVTWVASMYKNNPFHNFDHASHVVMSVIKLMSRIVAPTDQRVNENAASLHDHTYGITSDPLTQFACVFSALIHDVDHTGVPNTTLVSEQTSIAAKYNNRSVAEQNSLDLAWHELMNPTKYIELRAILFTDKAELIRFRKLVVNSVMATDIADKDLKTLRNNRWDKAFKIEQNDALSSKQDERDAVNRKATIVIEHLIQASDVSHTMQHWHVFRKWNQALFEEMYEAYHTGRATTNPADFWYQGEIGFFDFYIIPLAKKLKDCGVFGVSSDEYLNYAMKNREEWEVRGQEVVMEMVEAVAGYARKRKEQSSLAGNDVTDVKVETKLYVEC